MPVRRMLGADGPQALLEGAAPPSVEHRVSVGRRRRRGRLCSEPVAEFCGSRRRGAEQRNNARCASPARPHSARFSPRAAAGRHYPRPHRRSPPRGSRVKRYATDQIRNVALVGHGGAGKTTLAEALLHRAGAIPRMGRVEDGTTVCDFDPEEHKRGISLSLVAGPVRVARPQDQPRSTPPATPTSSATSPPRCASPTWRCSWSARSTGVEVQTEAAWQLAADLGVPRMVFVNKLDRERAELRRHARPAPRPARRRHRPARAADRRGGRLPGHRRPAHRHGLHLRGRRSRTPSRDPRRHGGARAPGPRQPRRGHRRGRRRPARALPRRRRPLGRRARAHPRTTASPTPSVFPVVCGSATREIGIDRLADFLVEIGPVAARPAGRSRSRPATSRRSRSPPTPTATRWPSCSRPSPTPTSARSACSGCCRARSAPTTTWSTPAPATTSASTACCTLRGKEQESASELVAGDIGAVAKLTDTATGDTLAPKGKPVRVAPIDQPEPVAGRGDRAPHPGRRGQAGHRAAPAARRGPVAARRAQRRDAPDAAAGHRRDPPADHPREARPASSASTSTPSRSGSPYRETITSR